MKKPRGRPKKPTKKQKVKVSITISPEIAKASSQGESRSEYFMNAAVFFELNKKETK